MAKQEYELTFDGYYLEDQLENIASISGIYCVYACKKSSKDSTKIRIRELLYIGESKDIRNRLINHEKLDDWKEHLDENEILCFSYAKIPNSSRERCEAAMIFKHEPPVNSLLIDIFNFDDTTISTKGENFNLSPCFTVTRTTT